MSEGVLACLMYIAYFNAHEFHMGDEKVFNNFDLWILGFCNIHMIVVDCYSKVYLHAYVLITYECYILMYTYYHLYLFH